MPGSRTRFRSRFPDGNGCGRLERNEPLIALTFPHAEDFKTSFVIRSSTERRVLRRPALTLSEISRLRTHLSAVSRRLVERDRATRSGYVFPANVVTADPSLLSITCRT